VDVVLKEFFEAVLFVLGYPFSFEVKLAGRLALVLNFKPFIYAIRVNQCR
jgi:hypothetical protein